MKILLVILILLRDNLAQRNYEYQNAITTPQNSQSSYYQNYPEYQSEAMVQSKWDLRNSKNSHITSNDDQYDSRNQRDFGHYSQSPHDWTSENSQSSQWLTTRQFRTSESYILSSKIENNSRNTHDYQYDSKNQRDFGYVSQSPHDWTSENSQSSSRWLTTRQLGTFQSSTLSSKIENNSRNSKTSVSKNKQSNIYGLLSNSTSQPKYLQRITTTTTTVTPMTEFETYASFQRKSSKATTRTTNKYSTSKTPTSSKNSITKAFTTKSSSRNSKKEYKRLSQRKYEKFVQKIFGDDDDSELDEGITFRNANFDGREVVEPGEYPHMTAIGYRRLDGSVDWKCGASLIDEYFVITAAHCTDFSGQKPSDVKIGDINLKVHEYYVEPQTIGIKDIYNHPKYNKSSYYNDIALLRLQTRVIFTKFVRPIRLYIKNNIPYDTVFAMGYGATAFGKAKTNILTDLNLTIVQNDECNQILPKEPASKGIISSQICAVDKEGNRDTCQGDSGGPLQLNLFGSKRIQYHLIGITSYGLFCGTQKPSVYTRISSFIDWIENTVWSDDL